MRRPLAGVWRDVQNALERHIVAPKAPRGLPHDGVADTGAENRRVCGHISRRQHQHRTIHDRTNLPFGKPLRQCQPRAFAGVSHVASDHAGQPGT